VLLVPVPEKSLDPLQERSGGFPLAALSARQGAGVDATDERV